MTESARTPSWVRLAMRFGSSLPESEHHMFGEFLDMVLLRAQQRMGN